MKTTFNKFSWSKLEFSVLVILLAMILGIINFALINSVYKHNYIQIHETICDTVQHGNNFDCHNRAYHMWLN